MWENKNVDKKVSVFGKTRENGTKRAEIWGFVSEDVLIFLFIENVHVVLR